jgi:REP-associated tyrosine transposase
MSTPVFYTRKLPHWQPREETFFITYRLAGSIPISTIEKLRQDYIKEKQHPDNQALEKKDEIRRKHFLAFENELDNNLNEPYWLKEEKIATIVMESLLFNDNKLYTLLATCIMSNHVHILLRLLPTASSLSIVMQNHKKFTAVHSNKFLQRSGPFWAEESFDTIIRDNSHFYNTVFYIIQNPVKARLVTDWYNWKWTYLHPEPDKEYRLKPK